MENPPPEKREESIFSTGLEIATKSSSTNRLGLLLISLITILGLTGDADNGVRTLYLAAAIVISIVWSVTILRSLRKERQQGVGMPETCIKGICRTAETAVAAIIAPAAIARLYLTGNLDTSKWPATWFFNLMINTGLTMMLMIVAAVHLKKILNAA